MGLSEKWKCEMNYRIADLTIQMNTFGKTETLAIPYGELSMSKNEVQIKISSEIEDVRNQMPHLPLASCEYIGSGYSFYKQLVKFNGLMLHSSAIIVDGKAYLFTADKGTGKSTHTGNWRCVFGDERVRVLNDDKPALRYSDGTWYAYGTPWCGKTGQNLNLRAPIAGIAEVIRGERNEIRRMDKQGAVQLLLKQTCIPDQIEMKMKLLGLIDMLIEQLPIWELRCTMDPASAIVAYEAMSAAND